MSGRSNSDILLKRTAINTYVCSRRHTLHAQAAGGTHTEVIKEEANNEY